MEHHRESLDEEVRQPFLQPITLWLAVSTTFDHRNQEICIHQAGRRDDLARWVFASGRNGGGLAENGGLVESEEYGTKKGSGLFIRIGLEIRMDVDDKGGADCREQTSLQERIR